MENVQYFIFQPPIDTSGSRNDAYYGISRNILVVSRCTKRMRSCMISTLSDTQIWSVDDSLRSIKVSEKTATELSSCKNVKKAFFVHDIITSRNSSTITLPLGALECLQNSYLFLQLALKRKLLMKVQPMLSCPFC